jgi:sigma-B regulation protein RsbU (phosphoserine phosphatase)
MTSLEGPNMPLGILPEGDFATSEILVEQGEMFALYTDGFLEAANAGGEEFGIARLEAELRAHGNGPLDAVYRSVQESVARHGAQFDDQSLLLIRRI